MNERTPTALDEQWPLEQARERVRAAVVQAWNDTALDEDRMSGLTGPDGAVDRAADVFSLHELVRETQGVDVRFCAFPGCFHPRRPSTGGGRPPAYCNVVRDARGDDGHTAIRSMRAKKALEAGERTPPVAGPEVTPAGVRPVSMARETVPEQVARVQTAVEVAVATLQRSMEDLRQQVALVGDEEAVRAEIEGIRNDTAREVTTANDARLKAEQDRRAAIRAKEKAEQDLVEAVQAAEEAQGLLEQTLADTEAREAQRAEEHRVFLENAQAELHAAKTAAEQAVAAAKAEAERVIAEAKAGVERIHRDAAAAVQRAQDAATTYKAELDEQLRTTLATWKSDHDKLVEEIRAKAAARVDEVEKDAKARVDAAEAAAAKARAEAEEAGRTVAAAEQTAKLAGEELDRERQALSELRAKVEADERRHQEALTRANDDVRDANQRVKDTQTRLDEQVKDARDELARVRQEHQERLDRDRQAREANDRTVKEAHDAQVKALQGTITTLREALDVARAATVTTPEPPTAGPQKRGKR